MVRRSTSKVVKYQDAENSDEESDFEDDYINSPKIKKTGSSKKNGTSKKRVPDYVSSEDEVEEEYVHKKIAKKKSTPKKPNSSKKIKLNPRKKISKPSLRKLEFSEDDEEEENEESEDDSDGSIYVTSSKKLSSSNDSKRISKLPPVSEMVIESIRALADNPRTGSTLGAIKETILLNWAINMKLYDKKIKKYIVNAEGTGEILRTKGNGFRGRFTLPGLKMKKKKKGKSKLSKKFDVDEVEYVPAKTGRDEERIKDKEELERKRTERALIMEKKILEKESLPRKPKPPKKEHFEVAAIQGIKTKNDEKYFLVKYVGSSKPSWQPEENLEGCRDLVEMFLKEEELKQREKEQIIKDAEKNGIFEVQRILEVKFKKDQSREFLIRWKGFNAESDTWESEENLNCEDLINAFMKKVESLQNVSQKSLRIMPKKVVRMAYSQSKRINKRTGCRATYEDME